MDKLQRAHVHVKYWVSTIYDFHHLLVTDTRTAPNIARKFEWTIHIPDHRYPNIVERMFYVNPMSFTMKVEDLPRKCFWSHFAEKSGLRQIFKCGIKSCGQWHQHRSRMRVQRRPQLPAQLSDEVLIQGSSSRGRVGTSSMQMNRDEINLNGGLARGKDNRGRHEIGGEKMKQRNEDQF